MLILLTPIGVLAPGTAWGEWSAGELEAHGRATSPPTSRGSAALWKAAMPDYATPGVSNPLLGYLIAAVVGAALVVGVTWGIGALLGRRRGDDEAGAAPSAPPATPAR